MKALAIIFAVLGVLTLCAVYSGLDYSRRAYDGCDRPYNCSRPNSHEEVCDCR